jgi:hypothetical protein
MFLIFLLALLFCAILIFVFAEEEPKVKYEFDGFSFVEKKKCHG